MTCSVTRWLDKGHLQHWNFAKNHKIYYSKFKILPNTHMNPFKWPKFFTKSAKCCHTEGTSNQSALLHSFTIRKCLYAISSSTNPLQKWNGPLCYYRDRNCSISVQKCSVSLHPSREWQPLWMGLKVNVQPTAK